ncbi:TonB-dependent siderophore receptor [Methylomonas sp. YC3]
MSKRKKNRILGQQPSRLHQAIQGLVLASALVASPTAMADSNDAKRNYHISGGSLSHALSEFAGSAGILLSVDARLTDGKTSKGLDGEYTVEEGFRRLLAGTGLTYTFTADDAVAVKAAESGSDAASALPAVKVVGKAVYDSTDPYNPDYSLPNASTATKTDTPVMETPFSVKAVPKQVLEDQQAVRLEKALQNVAGVVQEASSGLMRDSFVIRGFSTGNDILSYRDGSPYPQNGGNGYSTKRDPANLERVEVLKGPGSILFGRAEPGGVVNMVTKQPLDTPYYALQQQFGSFDYYRTTIDATGPVTKDSNLLYRLNAAYEGSGSFTDFANSDRFFVAPVLKWNIGPRTQFTTEFEYQRFDETPGSARITALRNGSHAYLSSLPRNLFTGEPSFNSNKGDRILAGFNWSHGFNDNWSISHRFYYTGINAEIRQAFLTGLADSQGNVGRGYEHQSARTDNYFTSLNLTGKINTLGIKHTLLFGGDYYRTDAKDPFDVRFIPGTFNLFNPVYNTVGFDGVDVSNRIAFGVDNTTSWYGLYAQDQIELPHNVFVLGGFRYDQADQYDHLTSSVAGDDNRVSPRGGLLWRPIPELSLYGSYTENFGAQNGINGNGQTLPPQTAQQWELGTKTELLNGRFSATLAYFNLTKQNLAVTDPNNTFLMTTVGAAESRGVELDISGELLPGWRVIGGYSHLFFANITRDVGFDGGIGNQGHRLPNAPHNSGNLFSTYEFQDGVLKGLKFGGGVTVLSKREGNPLNKYEIPGYATLNLMSSYAMKVGATKVTTQLNVDNLLDKYYYAGSSGGAEVYFGAPRTFLGSVRIEY